jgi:hypothetical protein
MALNGPEGVTSSVPIQTRLYGMVENYMIYSKFIYLCIFADLYVKLICFSRALFMNGLTWSTLGGADEKTYNRK